MVIARIGFLVMGLDNHNTIGVINFFKGAGKLDRDKC